MADIYGYITPEDWKPYIREVRLQMIIQEDLTIQEAAVRTAIDVVRDHLQPRYDIDGELGRSGLERRHQVVRWVLNLALAYIYERVPDKLVPERIKTAYDETRADLTAIADGTRETNLQPAQRVDGHPHTKFRFGGNNPRSEY